MPLNAGRLRGPFATPDIKLAAGVPMHGGLVDACQNGGRSTRTC